MRAVTCVERQVHHLGFLSVIAMLFCVSGPRHSLLSHALMGSCAAAHATFLRVILLFAFSGVPLLSLTQVPISGKPKSAQRTSKRLLGRSLLPSAWGGIHLLTETAEMQVLLQPSKSLQISAHSKLLLDQTAPPAAWFG